MSQRITHRNEAAASVLALMVAANGRIDPCEVQALDGLQAFERLGIRRERFLELAHGCLSFMRPPGRSGSPSAVRHR